MNPSALDRTAAWLLNMNVQYLDHEGMEPESLRNREDLTQVEKVTSLLIQPLTFLPTTPFTNPPRPSALILPLNYSSFLYLSLVPTFTPPLLKNTPSSLNDVLYLFPLCPCLSFLSLRSQRRTQIATIHHNMRIYNIKLR